MSLLYLGALILLGFLASRLVRRLGLPSVSGYLLVGVLLGPSALHWLGEPALATLKPIVAFGIATIFFLLGEEFKLQELRRMGGKLLAVTVVQSLATCTFATLALVLVGAPLPLAVLLGAVAGTSDPAATLGVIRELRGKGELVRTLLAVVALNGFVEMVLFSALMPVVDVLHRGPSALSAHALLWGPGYELGGSVLLGLALALVLRAWSLVPGSREALKTPTLGLILLGAGLCDFLHLSTLLVMLTFGALVANTVPVKVQVFDIAKAMEGPLLVMFFTLSGANMHIAQLVALGGIGVAYIGGRLTGKLTGAWLGARLAGAAPATRLYLGAGLIPQASMAIGLAYVIQDKFPDIAGPILPVVLGGVVVFEAIGPLLTRIAVIRSGEAAGAVVPAAPQVPVTA
jgi:Kef-type K+ transport system membrane component KefB